MVFGKWPSLTKIPFLVMMIVMMKLVAAKFFLKITLAR